MLMSSPTALADTNPRLVLAGDSTVTDKAGWGKGLVLYALGGIDVVNLSQGGRSSKSFRDEGHWQRALEERPEVILIQFGHNDQPGKGPERETDPATTYRDNLRRYIDEALAIGTKPVIVTSIERRRWDDDGLRIKPSLAAYADAARAVAKEKNVPCIDLRQRSIEIYESLGPKGCDLLSPVEADGSIDNTHLNDVGAEVFGGVVMDELRRLVPGIDRNTRGYVKPDQRFSTTQPTTVPNTEAQNAAFSAKAEPATPQGASTITVAADASGDVRTIQQALARVKPNNADRTTLHIKPGIYNGPIVVTRPMQNVTFQGDGPDKSIIRFALTVYDPVPEGTPNRMQGNGVIVLGKGFEARGLTFANTAGDRGQAMALRLQADRVKIEDCRLTGWQDTLLVHSGRHYFRNCHIEGRVDFIYGAGTSVFDGCRIVTKNGGYITAASTPEDREYGYLFHNCKISGWGKPAYLGRPWRPFAQVAFVKCEIGENILPAGWHNWDKESNEETARYVEHRNTGVGADRSQRVAWSRELTDAEAAGYTPQNYLKGADGWNPID
jgi:pectinesterase